jgi:hypothetical protein
MLTWIQDKARRGYFAERELVESEVRKWGWKRRYGVDTVRIEAFYNV